MLQLSHRALAEIPSAATKKPERGNSLSGLLVYASWLLLNLGLSDKFSGKHSKAFINNPDDVNSGIIITDINSQLTGLIV